MLKLNSITSQIGSNGRLGNCLFQAATVLALARRSNSIPVFAPWEYDQYFKKPLPTGPINVTHHYHEPYFHYTPIDLNDSLQQSPGLDKMFNLHGYFQTEKHFNDCTRMIKQQFEPSDELRQKLNEILFGLGQICSIHIRRGDYVGNDYYAQVDMDYYERAMFLIKELCKVDHFLIFSDDIPWCKQNFAGDQFIFMEGNKDIEDMFLMSLCDHNIIANSSFSWWAAYLNNTPCKHVIAPVKWFGGNSVLDTKDLYLKNWITI